MERTNERRTTESHQTNFTLMNCIAYSVSGALCVCLFNPLFPPPTPPKLGNFKRNCKEMGDGPAEPIQSALYS